MIRSAALESALMVMPQDTLPDANATDAPKVDEAGTPPEPAPDPTAAIVARRRPGRLLAGALVAVLVAAVLNSLARNPAFEWPVVGHYFTATAVLDGLLLTLWLTAATLALGFLLGTGLAVLRMSDNPVLRWTSWAYIWVFRSTPPLVQLLFFFNIGALYPTLSLRLPFGGPELAHARTVNLLGPTLTAVIGLTLLEAAFAAEVVRGGILSVERGQLEAAQSLGLGRLRVLRRIVLPQAMRSIVPAAGNMLIGALKGTSIVSVLAVHDLLYSVQLVYNQTYQIIPLLVVATLWYLAVTSVLAVGQHHLERYYARGHRPGGAA